MLYAFTGWGLKSCDLDCLSPFKASNWYMICLIVLIALSVSSLLSAFPIFILCYPYTFRGASDGHTCHKGQMAKSGGRRWVQFTLLWYLMYRAAIKWHIHIISNTWINFHFIFFQDVHLLASIRVSLRSIPTLMPLTLLPQQMVSPPPPQNLYYFWEYWKSRSTIGKIIILIL